MSPSWARVRSHRIWAVLSFASEPVQTRKRHRLALYVSAATHAAILGAGFVPGFTCVPEFEVPEFDFELEEIELIDPDAIQDENADLEVTPSAPPPEPPPPEPPPPQPPPEPEPGPEEKPPEPVVDPETKPEKKKFAARGSRADELAPPSSTFHMLLVPKKIRRLPFAQQVLDIMAPLPDFEFLVDGGRFDAMRDFNHIVIASPDIRDWTQTFLAVDYTISQEEVQRAIERAAATRNEVVEWVEDDGPLRANPRPADPDATDPDNRWFVFLGDNIAIYVRDEFLPNVLQGPQTDGRKTSGNYVANLSNLRRFARRQPRAGLQVVLKGLQRRVRKNPLPFKIPDEFEISVSSSKKPEVVVRGKFVDDIQAAAFLQWWNHDLREKVDSSFALKLQVGWILDLLEVEQEDSTVRLTGTMTTAQAQKILEFAADGSRKIAGKTPEEVAEMRQRRIDAIEARKGGKLPPSALDPKPDPEVTPEAGEPARSPRPTTLVLPSVDEPETPISGTTPTP